MKDSPLSVFLRHGKGGFFLFMENIVQEKDLLFSEMRKMKRGRLLCK